MSDYTPTKDRIVSWLMEGAYTGPGAEHRAEAFDAWLAEHDAKVRAEGREKADREPSDAESLARDAEEKYPIPAPVDHLTTSDYAMRVVFVQGRRQGYFDARKEVKR